MLELVLVYESNCQLQGPGTKREFPSVGGFLRYSLRDIEPEDSEKWKKRMKETAG